MTVTFVDIGGFYCDMDSVTLKPYERNLLIPFMKPYGKPTKVESTPGLSENDKVLQLAQAIINLTKDNRTTDEPLTAFPDGKVLKPTLYFRKFQGVQSGSYPDGHILQGQSFHIEGEIALQQKWLDTATGEEHWRDVPIVVTETFTVIPEHPEAPIEESSLSSPSEEIKTNPTPTTDAGNGIVE